MRSALHPCNLAAGCIAIKCHFDLAAALASLDHDEAMIDPINTRMPYTAVLRLANSMTRPANICAMGYSSM